MKLVMGLNSRDIKNSIRELELYRDSLKSKNTIFLEKLLDEGIEVAKENVGYYRYFIKFSKKVEDGETAVGFYLILLVLVKVLSLVKLMLSMMYGIGRSGEKTIRGSGIILKVLGLLILCIRLKWI